MKVLIPLLSKDENNAQFLEKAAENADHVTLLIVIDTLSGKERFGFTASQIAGCNSLAEEIIGSLKKKVAGIEQITEWGDTSTKIRQIAELRKVDIIFLKRQQNQFFDELVEQLRQGILTVEVID